MKKYIYLLNNKIKINEIKFLKNFIIFSMLSVIFMKILEVNPFFYIKLQLEFKKIENYLLLCKNNNNKLKKLQTHKKYNNPKISIISPVYNSEKFISRFLKSIENQNFLDIEIIMIDDCSIDKSVKTIEKYKAEDNRIILIKNKKNRGTFINRNIGVLFSKGKYLIAPDPDDILSKDILYLCYKYAEKYNYEIIRFNMYIGKGNTHINNIFQKLSNKPLYQPDLSTYIFYGINELKIIDCCVCNKFFKKEIYIKALNSLNNCYLNINIIHAEDTLMAYIIYRIAKSFYFLKKSGYYYIKNLGSVSNNLFIRTELRLKCSFILLNIIYEYSKNSIYEKDMSNFLLTDLIKNINIQKIILNLKSKSNKNSIYNIIKILLNSKYIYNENKNILECYKQLIQKLN